MKGIISALINVGFIVTIFVSPLEAIGATLLLEEEFEDSNFTSRDWYDGTTSKVLDTSDYSPNNGSTASIKYNFPLGSTKPTGGDAMRRIFTTAVEDVTVEFDVKYSSNWQGSGLTFHPHEMNILSDIDTAYNSLAYAYLNLYIEETALTPRLQIQDSKNINISYGTPPQDLTGETETRAVGGCNGNSGTAWTGRDCYYNVEWINSAWYDYSSAAITAGEWHTVKVRFKLNSVVGGIGQIDGIMQYWLDDNLLIDHHSVIYRTGQYPTLKLNQFVIAPYIGEGSPVDQTMWIDNLTVYETVESTTPQYTLTVDKIGTGDGLLLADSGAINCGSTCSDDYDESSSVVITAIPDGTSIFTSWSDGDCDEVNGLECTVYMGTQAQSVTTTFTATTGITCDAEHYYACTVENGCTTAGHYWYEDSCWTIPEPTDWTGTNVITNNDFSAWTAGMPDDWTSGTNEARIIENTYGVELQTIATDSQMNIRQAYAESGVVKGYRYVINFVENTGTVQVYVASDEPNVDTYTGVGTKTGILTYDGISDLNVYLVLEGGSINNTIINNIIIKEITSAQPIDIDISWVPNTEDELRGYNIHSGAESGVYTDTLDVSIPATGGDGRVHYTMNNVPVESPLCIVVSAYGRTEDTESAYSNEDCYNIVILPPSSFIIGSLPSGF